ncbi:lipase [Forsythia ovata]|uniref:Lipase n=1 Tax=Forsythia ovata TaxID=205694 RepID=A0ABD1TRB8_9LAMI
MVAKVSRIDWLRNAAGLLNPNYWRGTLSPRPVLDWYLKRVDEAVNEAKELAQGFCDLVTSVILAQSRLGKDDSELMELFKKVLKIQEKAFGSENEEFMETLKKIVHYLGQNVTQVET